MLVPLKKLRVTKQGRETKHNTEHHRRGGAYRTPPSMQAQYITHKYSNTQQSHDCTNNPLIARNIPLHKSLKFNRSAKLYISTI